MKCNYQSRGRSRTQAPLANFSLLPSQLLCPNLASSKAHPICILCERAATCVLGHSPRMKARNWGRDLVGRVLTVHEALGSIPVLHKPGVVMQAVTLALKRWRQEPPGHPQLHSEFKASLGYLRGCLKTKTKQEKIALLKLYSAVPRLGAFGWWGADIQYLKALSEISAGRCRTSEYFTH